MTEVCHVIERLVISNGDKDCQSGIFNVGAGVAESVLGMTKMIQQRCVQVLGFEPDLQRNQDLKEESPAPLIYQTARLDQFALNLGYTNYVDEIDKLLRYCETVFGCTKKLRHE